MKIDTKLIVICLGLAMIAILSAVAIRFAEQRINLRKSEKALPSSAKMIGHLPPGLDLKVDARTLLLVLPSCETTGYRDRFFLHIYTEVARKTQPEGFVNMDFELQNEKGREMLLDGVKRCVFEKGYVGLEVEAVSIGQFNAPNGNCCEITWSRNFNFGLTRK